MCTALALHSVQSVLVLVVLCKRGSLADHVHQSACAGTEKHRVSMYWYCLHSKMASSGMLWPCFAEHEASVAGHTRAMQRLPMLCCIARPRLHTKAAGKVV